MAENRLDKAIADVAYILDCLMAYRRIEETGCCNDCKRKGKCRDEPKLGEIVRYNCPFYKSKEMQGGDE